MLPVPMRPTTIRFAPDTFDLVTRAAENLGISVAQFVREAAIMRAILLPTERAEELSSLAARVQQLGRRDD